MNSTPLSEVGYKYIVGAGCEVPRGTPESNIQAMRDFAQSKTTDVQ
jgi:uroporphyrinogen-III decarboxylase